MGLALGPPQYRCAIHSALVHGGGGEALRQVQKSIVLAGNIFQQCGATS
jgi:hypothetical protein